MLCTKPNIAYAISVTSRFQVSPSKEYWEALKCILKYLKSTKDMALVNKDHDLRVDSWIDSNFHSHVRDRKSMSKLLTTLNRGAISWKSSKQSATVDSIAKA